MSIVKTRSKTHKILVALLCVTAITTGIVNSVGAESKVQLLAGVINVTGGVFILGSLIDEDCKGCHNGENKDHGY